MILMPVCMTRTSVFSCWRREARARHVYVKDGLIPEKGDDPSRLRCCAASCFVVSTCESVIRVVSHRNASVRCLRSRRVNVAPGIACVIAGQNPDKGDNSLAHVIPYGVTASRPIGCVCGGSWVAFGYLLPSDCSLVDVGKPVPGTFT